MVARKAERKACAKEKLIELKCAEWWYQGLSQVRLIKAERSVVLARSTRVPMWDHYNESTEFSRVRGERRAMPLLTSMTAGQGSNKSAEKGYGETWVTMGVNHGRTRSTKPLCRPNSRTGTSQSCTIRHT